MPLVIYNFAGVTEDFLQVNDDWSVSRPFGSDLAVYENGPTVSDLHVAASNFTKLNITQCIEAYIEPLKVTSELVLVLEWLSHQQPNRASLVFRSLSQNPRRYSPWDLASDWICASYSYRGKSLRNPWRFCEITWARTFEDHWLINVPYMQADPLAVTSNSSGRDVLVKHCLVGDFADNSSRCGLHYNAVISVFICVVTILDTVIVAWIALRHREPTMVVIGDALAEFLRNPESRPQPNAEIASKGIIDFGQAVWRPTKNRNYAVLRWKIWMLAMAM